MSKLASITSSPLIREYAQGAAQNMTSAIADFLAPTVPVGTSVGRFKRYDEKHRFRIPDTRRAIGGDATQLGFTASDKNYNCEPHALDVPVDFLERIEAEDYENLLKEGADMAAEVGALSHEKTVVTTALEALGAGTALSIGANDDIIDQLDKDILSVIKAAKYGALMGVGILFGAGAWRVVKNHASVKGRFLAGSKKNFAAPGLVDIGEMLISKADSRVSLLCFDDAAEGIDEDIKFILDGDIIVFARHPSPTRRDPSFMKTFRLRNQWMKPGTWAKPDGRVEFAKFDWSADVQVTNTLAGRRRTVNIA